MKMQLIKLKKKPNNVTTNEDWSTYEVNLDEVCCNFRY